MTIEELYDLRAKISSIRGVTKHKEDIFDAIDKLGLKLRKTHCTSCLRDYLQIIIDEIDDKLKKSLYGN